jgi:hypothetical protein
MSNILEQKKKESENKGGERTAVDVKLAPHAKQTTSRTKLA